VSKKSSKTNFGAACRWAKRCRKPPASNDADAQHGCAAMIHRTHTTNRSKCRLQTLPTRVRSQSKSTIAGQQGLTLWTC
jgi:hypothetical protein